MPWPTIFGNLAAGNQPLSLFDAMFTQVALMVAIPCTASGTNSITLTGIGNAPTLNSYQNYQMFRFKAPATSSGAFSAGYGALANLPVYKNDGITQIGNNDVQSGREYLLVFDSTRNSGNGGFYLEDASQALPGGAVAIPPDIPGGRLTYTSGVSVLAANVAGATTVYYTPHTHTYAPFNVSGAMQLQNFGGELSQLLSDATKSPAAAAVSSVYYMFLWNDSGVYRCTRGPAWTNFTTPGASNAIAVVNGMPVNAVGVTNGPGAQLGTLVGAIVTNAAATCDFTISASGNPSPVTAVTIDNLYNRCDIVTNWFSTANSWNYTVDAWRPINGVTLGNNYASYFLNCLLRHDYAIAEYKTPVSGGTSGGGAFSQPAVIGIGLGASSPIATSSFGTGVGFEVSAVAPIVPTLGYNFLAALERSPATDAPGMTNYGNIGDPVHYQMGFFYRGKF